MNNYEHIKSFSMSELAEWLDEFYSYEDFPWVKWFDENYCNKCDPIECKVENTNRKIEVAWCEINEGCKFIKYLAGFPSNKDIITLWLKDNV